MANAATNVTTGKPKIGGAIFVAPAGTELPTDTVAELNPAFKCLGYASEDGVTNANSPESGEIGSWGGDIVLNYVEKRPDTFAFKLIETLNEDVLKTVYGSDNVTGTIASGLTIKANAKDLDEYSWVFEMVLRGDVAKRIVVPSARITELEEIVYSDTEALGYGTTISASPDATGNTHYEYLKSAV